MADADRKTGDQVLERVLRPPKQVRRAHEPDEELGTDPGVDPAELALLCWLSGAAFILLVETSPI